MKKGLLSIIAFLLFSACNGGDMPEKTISFTALKDVPVSSWEKLAQKNIFFGHQSVGFNIIDGIKDLMRDSPQIKLDIVEFEKPSDLNAPVFCHAWVGNNMDPQSKIDSFANIVENGIGNKVDIAFFKLCFVDITDGRDVDNIFFEYKKAMSRLAKEYPKTRFIHVTIPLTWKPVGVKGWIRKIKDLVKKIIGRPVFDYYDNIPRNQFNDLLRKEYDGKEPMFDLAKVESTFPDGKRASFTKEGKAYYTLVPDYTYDGGHLNELGRQIAAEQLLVLLANLSE
jgi:hypothetical protein